MKGLIIIPIQSDLLEAYNELLANQAITNKKLALYSQWTRFDPRLAEIMTSYLSQNWLRFSAVELHKQILKQPWPQALSVLLDFAESKLRNTRSRKDFSFFSLWKKTVTYRIPPAHGEQYYIGVESFAGKRMQKMAGESLPEFTRRGYLAKDAPINKNIEYPKIPRGPKERQKWIKETLKKQNKISVTQYLSSLNFTISRRQAERDLADSGLQPKGFTRSRFYLKK